MESEKQYIIDKQVGKIKRILIAINSLSYGGIQKALINLLKEISMREDYDITLLLTRKKGAYLDQIPENIKVINANKLWSLLETQNKESRENNFFLWIIRGVLVVLNRMGKHKLVMKFLEKTQSNVGNYDIAISFRHPDKVENFAGGSNELVLNCCSASLKATFIHCDYINYGGESPYNNQLISRFDRVAVVSKSCEKQLLKAIPQLTGRTRCVYNCQNYNEIKYLSQQGRVDYCHDRPVFVTICRLGAEKGINRMLSVLYKLRSEQFDFEWHIIGDGEERNSIEKLIELNDLKDNVILEGATTNPYRYIPDADFFLLPSFHEAAPVVIGEALCLGVPVVSTKTLSADEMISSEIGYIIENSEDALYYGIKKLFLEGKDSLLKMREHIKTLAFNNEIAINQFVKLIDGE